MDEFWVQVFLSFLVGGLYIASTLFVAEKLGSRWGGVFTGLPSTSLVGFLFIGFTQGNDVLRQAMPVVPAALALSAFFLFGFLVLYRFGLYPALLSATALWFFLGVPLAWADPQDFLVTLAVGVLVQVLALWYLRRFSHQKLPSRSFHGSEFLFRAAFSGFIVALAVFLAKSLGPAWGGLFSMYPAAYTSTLFLLSRKHGFSFVSSVSKTMPLGAMGILVFSVALYFLLPAYGLLESLVAGYLLSALFAFGLAFLLKRF